MKKPSSRFFFFGPCSETHSVLNLQVWKSNPFNKTREKSLRVDVDVAFFFFFVLHGSPYRLEERAGRAEAG